MTAALRSVPQAGAADDRLDWLLRHIAGNRFIPEPPADRRFVGDGDFRAIGVEFLGHFVRLGGLAPTARVLDIGCGIGRMALPLTQYLDPDRGRYHGVDVVADGIAWCSQAISPAYENFQFRHVDFHNPIYNPGGRLAPQRPRLPFADGEFDFVILTSVLTHLRAPAAAGYAAEIARLLADGGRCFLSLFLLDDSARALLAEGRPRLRFALDGPGPDYFADPDRPEAAVAYDEPHLVGLFEAAGLRLHRPIAHGSWPGRPAPHYQDFCVLEKRAPASGSGP